MIPTFFSYMVSFEGRKKNRMGDGGFHFKARCTEMSRMWVCSMLKNTKKMANKPLLVGGSATPLKNMKVNWDDDIPNIWEKKKWQPNHQPDYVGAYLVHFVRTSCSQPNKEEAEMITHSSCQLKLFGYPSFRTAPSKPLGTQLLSTWLVKPAYPNHWTVTCQKKSSKPSKTYEKVSL